jgi:hypothetical protein
VKERRLVDLLSAHQALDPMSSGDRMACSSQGEKLHRSPYRGKAFAKFAAGQARISGENACVHGGSVISL